MTTRDVLEFKPTYNGSGWSVMAAKGMRWTPDGYRPAYVRKAISERQAMAYFERARRAFMDPWAELTRLGRREQRQWGLSKPWASYGQPGCS
jgi:hypothetical protein